MEGKAGAARSLQGALVLVFLSSSHAVTTRPQFKLPSSHFLFPCCCPDNLYDLYPEWFSNLTTVELSVEAFRGRTQQMKVSACGNSSDCWDWVVVGLEKLECPS